VAFRQRYEEAARQLAESAPAGRIASLESSRAEQTSRTRCSRLINRTLGAEERGFYEHDNAGFSAHAETAIGIVSHEARAVSAHFRKLAE
jgi:hypothetical protein